MNPSWSDVGGVHPGSGRPLVELHHLLAFLEQPEEGGDAADIKDVGADAHQVVQDSGQLGKHHWSIEAKMLFFNFLDKLLQS